MKIFVLQVTILLLSFASSKSWLLKTSSNNVIKNVTPNISLECFYDGYDNNSPKLEEIYGLRILKFSRNDKWETIAKISVLHSAIETSLTEADVTGHLKDLSNSFLTVNFQIATSDTIGQFLCEADGYAENSEFESVRTRPALISEQGVNTYDLLKLIIDLKSKEHDNYGILQQEVDDLKETASRIERKYDTRLKDVEKNIASEMRKMSLRISVDSSKFTSQNNKILQRLENLEKEMSKQRKMIKSFSKNYHSQQQRDEWPVGSYAMLKPKSGCPLSATFDWVAGQVDFKASASLSKPSHLTPLPIIVADEHEFKIHVATMNSCVKTVTVEGPQWPVGHYCIQKNSGEEISGFTSGWIKYRSWKPMGDRVHNIIDYQQTDSFTRLGYWCRQDGSVKDPIVLPSKEPFYLYRYGGTCQTVLGMSVTNEWISMKMETDSLGGTHPDISLGPWKVKLELCYYTPK